MTSINNNKKCDNNDDKSIQLDVEEKNHIQLTKSFDNLLIFSDEFDKINILSKKIEELFLLSTSYTARKFINSINELDNINQVIFNYIYEKEIERGNIEYKRSLESYNKNDKIKKLIRQIYWRIYEGVVSIDKECCYYIIGIEDSGSPSFLTKNEIFNSLYFICETLSNTELNYSYLLVKNTILNYNYLIVKFWPNITDLIDFF